MHSHLHVACTVAIWLNGREACMHAQFPFTQFDRSASLLLLVVQPLPLGLDLYRTGAS